MPLSSPAFWGAFTGGWPCATVRPSPLFPFVWGVVPSLVAAVAVIMPPWAGLVVLGFLLIACYLVDRKQYRLFHMNGWLTLRFRLTIVASLCCFLGASGV